jgi:glycosyltransferase involved in cell wall biosynthesis
MKDNHSYKKLYLFLAIYLFTGVIPILCADRHFVVIIPSRNNSSWCERNLQALMEQWYTNWHAIYINDASTDDTQKKVEGFIRTHHLEDKIRLINNETRQGAMANIYNAIYMCDDWDVIVIYDGDDWFGRPNVFNVLNRAYAENVWMTYGSHRNYPQGNRSDCAYQVPNQVIAENSYRKHPWCTSHLRTFYAWLFKSIRTEDLKMDGAFYAMTCDQATMFPMLEMSGNRAKYINDILYIYNMENPLNDNKVDAALQMMIEKRIREQPPYERLKTVPDRYLPRR